LLVAAWFHDAGYVKGEKDHELESACIAAEFLEQQGIDETEIAAVKQCILATKYPQKPANHLEAILCDADLFHLGENNFTERSELLRKEFANTKGTSCTDAEWMENNLAFLDNHSFHTDYCRKLATVNKARNINRLQERHVDPGSHSSPADRGIDTLFKMTSGNHMRLSGMADNKAHILLSINSIIISIVLTLLIKNLHGKTFLIAPTALLLAVCLVTIVFAVLATKPKVSAGVFTAEQVRKHEVNLLFFGNFHNMAWETYEWGIREMMNDKQYLYKSMYKDIYILGKVLAAKYRFLNIGYRVFMFGLIASVFTFAFCFLWSY
jgi:hypothetical protein